MNKEEYLKELDEQLKDADESTKEELIDDFKRHFEIGQKMGMDDEEIIKELGDVKEAIADMNFKKTRISYSDDEFVSTLYIDSGAANVRLVESNVEHIESYLESVLPTSLDRFKLDTHTENETYTIKVIRTSNLFSFISNITLVVNVPKNLKQVILEGKSGNVSLDGLHLLNALVKNASGDIHSKQTEISTYALETISGDIKVDNQKGSIKASTTSGEIELTNINGENALINTTSGDIDIVGDYRKVDLSSVSGDIEITVSKIESINAQSVSGDIEIEDKDPTPSEISVISTSGDVEIDLATKGYYAEISTVSGDIELKGDYTKEGNVYKMGENIKNISINTISGDISIE